MTTTYESPGYLATIKMKPGEASLFRHVWDVVASISGGASTVWKNRQEDSAVLSGTDASSANILSGQKITIPDDAWGQTYIYQFKANVAGKVEVKWLRIEVADYRRLSDYDFDILFVPPDYAAAFVHRWNSTAEISSPTTAVFLNGQNVSGDVLSGAESSSLNIQTGRVFTIPESSWGNMYCYQWKCVAEDRTLVKWLPIVSQSLPL